MVGHRRFSCVLGDYRRPRNIHNFFPIPAKCIHGLDASSVSWAMALTLAAVIPVAAYAASSGNDAHHRGNRLERMAQTLNLDDAQKARMQTLFAEQCAQRTAQREQMRSQISEILNDDQRAKFAELRAQRRAKHKSKRGRHQHKSYARDEGASQKTS